MAVRQRNARGEGRKLRDDLLVAAQRLLERTGSEDAVSLRAVAREAGVSAPSIYAHFPDGRAIVDELVQQTFAQLSALLREARDQSGPGDRLFTICMAYIRFGLRQPERYLTLFERRRSLARTEQLAAGGPAFLYPNGAEAFGILVEALAESTGATRDLAEQHAALLWAALHGYVTLRASSPKFPWFADEEQVCRELVDRAVYYARAHHS
ncbi:TetR/AcrR family transcriptional regulator [Mycobacterium manitobense]|uniref:TetR/AcrR family transcriptional regulator n=1 Tax=[Mycobacterium] manitobense TaxID=190147 RepID=A0A9X2Y9D0_9MYCO|nr:TetR/AcrR family transcriptional regulator [[Mycobacterium] manitobense]MCV7170377.1 TetR/AcrR family transcriptional regulator [[Mycobacterium] manitobense]